MDARLREDEGEGDQAAAAALMAAASGEAPPAEPHSPLGDSPLARADGAARARSHSRVVRPLIRSILDC